MNNTGKNLAYLTLALSACAILLNACKVTIPKGARAVKPFDSKRYLGKWYEIARLDFKYEKNLNNVTATYTEKDKGQIRVNNQGYDTVKKEWKQSIGKAKLVKSPDEARLKVSFFGPFYSGYNVIAIDADYQYALVAGNNLKYLWILSRTTTIPDSVKEAYLQQAKKLGYQTDDLVWTAHNNKSSDAY